jgi:hypothetical protein
MAFTLNGLMIKYELLRSKYINVVEFLQLVNKL